VRLFWTIAARYNGFAAGSCGYAEGQWTESESGAEIA
jgi:hypothetical protein